MSPLTLKALKKLKDKINFEKRSNSAIIYQTLKKFKQVSNKNK